MDELQPIDSPYLIKPQLDTTSAGTWDVLYNNSHDELNGDCSILARLMFVLTHIFPDPLEERSFFRRLFIVKVCELKYALFLVGHRKLLSVLCGFKGHVHQLSGRSSYAH